MPGGRRFDPCEHGISPSRLEPRAPRRAAGSTRAQRRHEAEAVGVVTDEPGDEVDATIWLIAFDDRHDVLIERGENRGRTLRYHHVVRELTRLGYWHGRAVELELPLAALGAAGRDGAAILVQRLDDGAVLAATRLSLTPG